MIKIGIVGITGKVGTIVAQIVENDDQLELAGGISSKSTDADLENVARNSDVLIDFSLPISSMRAVEVAQKFELPFVCGTTGLSEVDFQKLNEFSKKIPIIYASNFSIAVHLMAKLLKQCEIILRDYDITIIDKHHKSKKDAPSGTSIFLSKQLNRKAQMLSVRSGNIPAEMVCDFCGDDDMLTISHRSFGRTVFAKGAIACAKWIIGKKAGIYSMEDFIGKEC
ncbi:MAG: 4-hydroxy-tetrahydrodipicolinate reductase [Alphaproteobacteria bacterium]|nr:4-hydroxy-tetrahydrodipicolinate reductase [Alphaproteobacteria bacterium]